MSNRNLHFVISAPRSGSTWLTTALNQHPQIFATEHRLLGQFCEVWKNNDGTTSPRITFDSYARAFAMHYFYSFMDLDYDGFVDEFQRAFADFMVDFAQKRTDKTVIVDKITPYLGTTDLVVEQIKKLFPDSNVIQLVRDGRDVLTSGTFDWLLKDAVGTQRHDFFVKRKSPMVLDRFFDDDVIDKWTVNWKETILGFRDSQPMQLTYESMQSGLSLELMKVFDVLGVESSAEIAENCERQTTFKNMTGREPGADDPTAKARKGIVGDWKNYFTKADGVRFDKLAGQELISLGYEPDRSWLDRLPQTLSLTQNVNEEQAS